MTTAIEATGLTKRFGRTLALDGLELLSLIHISEPTRRS